MAEAKKRFPWWLVVCAALLVPLAAALGLIETVGRRGTLVGRYERLKEGMSKEEIRAILGAPQARLSIAPSEMNAWVWDDGPAKVSVWLDHHGDVLYSPHLTVENLPPTVWRVRRWAERAYSAIHDPRR